MRDGQIRLIEPEFPSISDIAQFLEVSYREKYFSNFGPNVRALEQELGDYLGLGRSVVTVASATTGLAATLLALDVKGIIVIPSYTFTATVSAVHMAGCEPYPVDVDPETWELDAIRLDTVLDRQRVGAVIHVRPLGLCRPLDSLSERLAERQIPLIVDSAAAFGGLDASGRKVGAAGLAEVFSFHATKPFGIGEGGAIVSSPELSDRIRSVVNFGIASAGIRPHRGLNGKMSELHAAVGRAVLRTYSRKLTFRQAQGGLWIRYLRHSRIKLPVQPGLPPWQVFPMRMPMDTAETVKASLASIGIESRIYYQPALPLADGSVPSAADALSKEVLCLPVGSHVNERVISDAAAVIGKCLGRS